VSRDGERGSGSYFFTETVRLYRIAGNPLQLAPCIPEVSRHAPLGGVLRNEPSRGVAKAGHADGMPKVLRDVLAKKRAHYDYYAGLLDSQADRSDE
jgi:hypothetical protein